MSGEGHALETETGRSTTGWRTKHGRATRKFSAKDSVHALTVGGPRGRLMAAVSIVNLGGRSMGWLDIDG